MKRLAVTVLVLALAAPAAAAPRLHADGRWFRDAAGRVRILHGVAVMDFSATHDVEAVGFGADDARFLARHGFTVVRVGFNWEKAEPAPGEISPTYLAALRRTVRRLGRVGIATVLDAHQDGYGPLVGTDGAPAWATLTDGLPNTHIAFGVDYFENQALLRAFDNLYANKDGVADRFAAMWAAVARATRDVPGLLGYELINEPYPGSSYPACAQPEGCEAQDQVLSAFYRRITPAVRAVDPRHTILYEPHLFFDFGVKTHLRDPSGGRGNVAFAFHDYCLGGGAGDAAPPVPGNGLGCGVEETMVIDNAEAYAGDRQPQIVTEWAATDDLEITQRVADELDAARLSETFWAYNGRRFVTDMRKPPRGENLNAGALAILDRPYPRIVAGEPGAWSWDAPARTFRFEYEPRGRRASEVWLPRARFPDGYAARVTGARVISRPGARRLRLRARRTAERVTVVVTGRHSRR